MTTETTETSRTIKRRIRDLIRAELHEPLKRGDPLDRAKLIEAIGAITAATQTNGQRCRMDLAEVGDALLTIGLHLRLAGGK
ncbi:hypothetical protein ACFL51_01350 [Myxococcota bacterium]